MSKEQIIISPSLLAADFARLADELDDIAAGGAEYIHLDVMDGVFVPNISFGLPVVSSLRRVSKLFFDTQQPSLRISSNTLCATSTHSAKSVFPRRDFASTAVVSCLPQRSLS